MNVGRQPGRREFFHFSILTLANYEYILAPFPPKFAATPSTVRLDRRHLFVRPSVVNWPLTR